MTFQTEAVIRVVKFDIPVIYDILSATVPPISVRTIQCLPYWFTGRNALYRLNVMYALKK